MHLFYIPDISGDSLVLNETESRHCVKVLRLGKGGQVQLVDGKGGFYHAQIEIPDQKKCQLKIIEAETAYQKHGYSLHIAIAPTKNTDRIEWFIEKATEIGIDEITPLLCRFSERKNIKVERLQNIAVSAMKQSLKAYLPKVNALQKFNDLIKQPFNGNKFIAHCYAGEKAALKEKIKPGDKVLILIGPEGDFSPEEVGIAKEHGFIEISLGNSRLRTETAGIVACHTVSLMGGK